MTNSGRVIPVVMKLAGYMVSNGRERERERREIEIRRAASIHQYGSTRIVQVDSKTKAQYSVANIGNSNKIDSSRDIEITVQQKLGANKQVNRK
jgi:hypothetical protein